MSLTARHAGGSSGMTSARRHQAPDHSTYRTNLSRPDGLFGPLLAIEQTGSYIAYTADNDAIGRQWLRDATALPPQRQERSMAHPNPHTSNRVLAALAPADLAQLLPQLLRLVGTR